MPWRERVRTLQARLRAFGREHHAEMIAARLEARFGNPPVAEHEADIERAIDDLLAEPASAGPDRSIVRAFSEDAPDLDVQDRNEVLRWESERRRGVFLMQRCHRDRMEVWDPLEGAGLTLHLLERMPGARSSEVRPGTVVTTEYLPYMARLIAVGFIEMYGDERALKLYRDEVRNSGATWHAPPPVAPASAPRSAAPGPRRT